MAELYSQRDSRWRDKALVPGYNFAGFGHLTTCIAMVASLAGYTDTPPEVARKLASAYVGRFITNYELIPTVYPKLEWNGIVDWRGGTPDLRWLKSKLPVIAEVAFVPGGAKVPRSRHYVIAESLTRCDIQVIDPWTGTRCNLLERYALDNWNVRDAILQVLLLRPGTGEVQCL